MSRHSSQSAGGIESLLCHLSMSVTDLAGAAVAQLSRQALLMKCTDVVASDHSMRAVHVPVDYTNTTTHFSGLESYTT